MNVQSGNFRFLEPHNVQLVRLGALAERYFHDDPNRPAPNRATGNSGCRLSAKSNRQNEFGQVRCKNTAYFVSAGLKAALIKGELRTSDATRKSLAGRKPWDEVIIFKSLVLQALYNLSDDQAEYQLRDRFSFMRFLGLELEMRLPTPRLCA